MSQPPLFPSFDGLMHLAKREGVDIRPTLLRVLTDLYVQAPGHSAEEQQHYVELASRLIAQVDEATRSVVRARLAVYPDTPHEIRELLGLAKPVALPQAVMDAEPLPQTEQQQTETAGRRETKLSMQPDDAASIDEMFMGAASTERIQILRNLETSPLRPAARIEPLRAGRAVAVLERAAFAARPVRLRRRAFGCAVVAGVRRRTHRRRRERRSARLRRQDAGDADRTSSSACCCS